MANFYYAANGQSQGPINDAELDRMVASGGVAGDTLIWTEGMAEWQPYTTLRRASIATPAAGTAINPVAIAAPPIAGGVVCAVCQQVFPPDQVIRYGASYVCGNCKPQFLQKLR